MGNGTGEYADSSVDSCTSATPHLHPRTASRSRNIAQSMARSNANAAESRMNAQRLLGHSRVLSIDRAAAARAPQRAKPRSFTTTTIPTTPASASATMGFWDPLVVRREENEARSEAAPPRFSCPSFCWLFCLVGRVFFLKDFRALLTAQFPLSTTFSHLLIALRAFSRVCVRVCIHSRNWIHVHSTA
ncbi:hypothetical protein BGY98DRAFT_993099 [Russula aff. rugulosa BPL654]|nr:hypothetical protein BGY98DRAFT_993099 [Russula aff. rugulosa BPL654]